MSAEPAPEVETTPTEIPVPPAEDELTKDQLIELLDASLEEVGKIDFQKTIFERIQGQIEAKKLTDEDAILDCVNDESQKVLKEIDSRVSKVDILSARGITETQVEAALIKFAEDEDILKRNQTLAEAVSQPKEPVTVPEDLTLEKLLPAVEIMFNFSVQIMQEELIKLLLSLKGDRSLEDQFTKLHMKVNLKVAAILEEATGYTYEVIEAAMAKYAEEESLQLIVQEGMVVQQAAIGEVAAAFDEGRVKIESSEDGRMRVMLLPRPKPATTEGSSEPAKHGKKKPRRSGKLSRKAIPVAGLSGAMAFMNLDKTSTTAAPATETTDAPAETEEEEEEEEEAPLVDVVISPDEDADQKPAGEAPKDE